MASLHETAKVGEVLSGGRTLAIACLPGGLALMFLAFLNVAFFGSKEVLEKFLGRLMKAHLIG